MNTALASDAGKPRTTKGRPQIAQEPTIYPRDTHIHLLRDAMATLQVRRPDRGGQTVFRIVRNAYCLLFRIKGSDMTDWPENFFLHTARRFRQSSIDRRF